MGSCMATLLSPYMCRDLRFRNIANDLRDRQDVWDGSGDPAGKATAYMVDVVSVRGVGAKHYRTHLPLCLKCLSDQMAVKVEMSLFPNDDILGKQVKVTSPNIAVEGLGCNFSPVERFVFGYTSDVSSTSDGGSSGVVAANPISNGNHSEEVDSALQRAMIQRKSMRSFLQLKINLRSDANGKLIGSNIYDLSKMKTDAKLRYVDVDILSPVDGQTIEGRVTIHIECRPLREVICEEVHTVVEYQRYNPVKAEWARDFLWSDPNGGVCDFSTLNATRFGDSIHSVAEKLKERYIVERDWLADTAGGDVEGWCYGTSFLDQRWTIEKDSTSYVRRRGWVRVVRKLSGNEDTNEAVRKARRRMTEAHF